TAGAPPPIRHMRNRSVVHAGKRSSRSSQRTEPDHGGARTSMGNVGDSVRTVSTAQAISWDDHKSRTISRSITWNDKKVRPVGAALIVALGGVMWAGAANAALHHASHTVSVVVRAQSGQQG